MRRRTNILIGSGAAMALLTVGYLVYTRNAAPGPVDDPITDSATPPPPAGDPVDINNRMVVAAELPAAQPPPPAKQDPVPSGAVKLPKTGPVRIRKGDPIPELFPNQAQRDEIIRLATLPAEQSLSTIATYLKHEDATVREEARTALVRLSSPLAIPYLKEAASTAKSAEEAALLKEAAEFLALVPTEPTLRSETPSS